MVDRTGRLGSFDFLQSNLTRGKPDRIPNSVSRTQVYDTPNQSLPWYNTLVWTVLVTPVGFLLMASVGFWATLRNWRSEPIGLLIAGNWTFLVVLRAMPHTPGHDGVRLFLPAFGLLALLGGLGARFLLDHWGKWAKLAIFAALIEGIVEHRGDDARAAFLLQPDRGWAARCDGVGHGANLLLGRTRLRCATLAGRKYALRGGHSAS